MKTTSGLRANEKPGEDIYSACNNLHLQYLKKKCY